MAIQEDGKIYIKLDPRGERNSSDKCWDDGIGGQIKQILLWHDAYFISGFQTIYKRSGISQISKRHGGTEGNFETINPKKPLTWLSGHYGSYCFERDVDYLLNEDDFYKCILSLKFGNEEETYGPFGCEEGTPFFFRGSNEIVGFHGLSYEATASSLGYISTIGIYIKTEAVGVIGQPSNPNGSIEMIEDKFKLQLISGK